jgi:hypothetical protein
MSRLRARARTQTAGTTRGTFSRYTGAPLLLVEDLSARVAALVRRRCGGLHFTTRLARGSIVPAGSQRCAPSYVPV